MLVRNKTQVTKPTNFSSSLASAHFSRFSSLKLSGDPPATTCDKLAATTGDPPATAGNPASAFSMMEGQNLFSKLMINLRAPCKYYNGYPKDLGQSKVIHFTSEREFVQLLHQGHRVVVAFTVKGNYTRHLDKVLEEAAAEFYPNVKFLRVECPKYPGFCITRQKKEYPFIEIFHSPEQTLNQGKVADPNITRYSVKVLPFNYDLSAYGFREFFKRHGIQSSNAQ